MTQDYINAIHAVAVSVGLTSPAFLAGPDPIIFRAAYTLTGPDGMPAINARGESLTLEISTNDNGELSRAWHKSGCTPTTLRRWWCLTTYVTGKDCTTGKYNPQRAGKRIDFAYMLEATPANLAVILTEAVNRFFAA